MKRYFLGGTAVLAIATTLGSTAAYAQKTKGGEGLEEIIVTAQKREESLQRAAVAVTAVTGDTLSRAGIVDATSLSRVVPSLQILNAGGTTNLFYLRGVGNFVTNSFTDPAVTFNLDGTYIAHPNMTSGMFYDLDRVEVLKGPQGTLYGRNATGGAINLITAKPKLGELSGYAAAEYGNFDNKKFNGAINIPIGDNSALRFAGQVVDRDGYYSDGTGDDVAQSARLQYIYEGEGVKITAGADYTHQGGLGAGATVHGLDPDDRIGLTSPAAQAAYTSTYTGLAGDFLHPLRIGDIYNDNHQWGLYVQADIDTSLGTLTILPAYRHAKLDFNNASAGFFTRNLETDDTTSVEVRLTSKSDGPFKYVLGGFYFHDTDDQTATYHQNVAAFYTHFLPKTDSYATFASLTYSLTDDFRVTGGLRYTIDSKSAKYTSLGVDVICLGASCPGTPELPNTLVAPSYFYDDQGNVIPFQIFPPAGPAFLAAAYGERSLSREFKKLTYRAGIEWDVAPQSMFYATYETGFKSGGFFVSIDNPIADPETMSAFTVGVKNRFLDNRLQINIEIYDWIYKDQQFSHLKPNTIGQIEFVTENIGKSEFRGIEVEAVARPWPNTILNATVQYNDAKNKEFKYESPDLLGPPNTGCPFAVSSTPGFFTVDCAGFRPAHAPLWTIVAGVEQKIPLGSIGDLTFNGTWRYQSSEYESFELLPVQLQKAYSMTDLSLTYSDSKGGFWASVFVNNVEDKAVSSFTQPVPRTANLVIDALRPPRTYGGRIGYKF